MECGLRSHDRRPSGRTSGSAVDQRVRAAGRSGRMQDVAPASQHERGRPPSVPSRRRQRVGLELGPAGPELHEGMGRQSKDCDGRFRRTPNSRAIADAGRLPLSTNSTASRLNAGHCLRALMGHLLGTCCPRLKVSVESGPPHNDPTRGAILWSAGSDRKIVRASAR